MTIYDPPDEVIVVSYVWSSKGASGGRREIFTSMREAKRHLSEIFGSKSYDDTRPVQALRSTGFGWEPLAIEMPKPLELRPIDGGDQ